MLKNIILLIALFLATSITCIPAASGQNVSRQLQANRNIPEEELIRAWDKIPGSVTVGFTTGAERMGPRLPQSTTFDQIWKPTSWRNEKIHTQIAIVSRKGINNVSFSIDKLKDARGNNIVADLTTTGFVDNVMVDEYKGGCGYRTPENFDSSLAADIINPELKNATVPANGTRLIWISFRVPKNAEAGIYKGTVTVTADKAMFMLPIELTVVPKVLPDSKDWHFQLDLWQHPAAIARVHNLSLWSNEHFEVMRKYYTMLAGAGQKIITASIVDEPWNHQTYDDFPGLIKWVKKADGNWTFDYSLFDKYIEFVMSCGISERINCYSMVPWKIQFPYFDEETQKEVLFTQAIGTPEYNEFWGTMLKNFTLHLKKKGWFDKTVIAMDERPMKSMQAVISLLKSIDSGWKVALAGDYHPQIEDNIFDYCVASRWTFPDSVMIKRTRLGKLSTWYTCCTEEYPNGFTFSPPDENAWIGWYTAAQNMSGYLRWAFNSWPAHPLQDSRFTAWPSGDTYQVYPGPMSSIRFEKLIEGIQDFEKIRMLRDEYKRRNNLAKLNQLEVALMNFRIENLATESATQMISEAKYLLNR